jgi:NAD(P)H-hydrate epimerase
MVFPVSRSDSVDFHADAILLGPGWGKTQDRVLVLEQALDLEKKGIPLILDADAIELAQDKVFDGNVILTPHPMEFSKFSGIAKEELLCRPVPILLKFAQKRKAVILFKGHVITIVAPDGRFGVLDGMTPGLAAGGSGDLLAGFCAAIAARMVQEGRFDGYTCAAAAAALLIESGRSEEFRTRFTDPLELANKAADLAGDAWLRVKLPVV